MQPASGKTRHIGIDGDTLGRKRTGDESYLASLIRALSRVDGSNRYTVFVRDAQTVGEQFGSMPRFTFQPVKPASIWVRHPFSFPLALRRTDLDLLHVQYFVPPFTRSPVVITVHDISFAVCPQYFTRRDRILLNALVPHSLRRSDRIITDAEYTRQDMVRTYGLDPSRIDVIPLAADPKYRVLDREQARATVRARHDVADGFILYVGTLQPRKNVATLVQAYGRFRQRSGLPHKLLIVGKAKYRYETVFEAIEHCGYANDVVFAGFVADDELPLYYNAADLFVFPTLYEGFGLPVLESMACGTPVLCSDTSSLPEVAGDAATLVGPMDVEGFADGMARLLSNPSDWLSMQQKGLARAAEFSWDRTARETLAVYERVISQ